MGQFFEFVFGKLAMLQLILEPVFAVLDLFHHMVECIDELAYLVVARTGHAPRKIVVLGDGFGRRRNLFDRLCDHAAEAAGNQQGHGERNEGGNCQRHNLLCHGQKLVGQVGHDPDMTNRFAVDNDVFGGAENGVPEIVATGLLHFEVARDSGIAVTGKEFVLAAVNLGKQDFRFDAQGGQRGLGRFGVVENQG